jgi:hypothetical protein
VEYPVASFEIDGSWDGEYSFDPSEALSEIPPGARFTLTVQAAWFQAFTGVIQDDPEKGVPEPAVVRGNVRGSNITFTKRYPAIFCYLGGRTVSLAEYLESEFGLPLDYEVPGNAIHYEGEYDFAQEGVTGTWYIEPQYIRISCDGQPQGIEIQAIGGHWTMRRSRSR